MFDWKLFFKNSLLFYTYLYLIYVFGTFIKYSLLFFQARYLQYTSKLDPDTQVSEAFQKRLYKIAAAVTLNRTEVAQYDSQLLVRDFGTHVITSLDVGAALVQVTQWHIHWVVKQCLTWTYCCNEQ